MSKITCTKARYFAERYIKGEVSDKLKEEILEHITDCDECFQYYMDLAKTMRRNLDLDAFTISNAECDAMPKPANVVRKNKSIVEICPYTTWSDACRATDLTVMMQVKALRDFFTETVDVNEGESEIFRNFGLYICRKICQRVDHLEACFNLDDTKEGDNDK